MAMKGGNPQNLNPGGTPGNKGGGRWTARQREIKAEFFGSIIYADGSDYNAPDHETVADALKAKVAREALTGNGNMAQWLLEQEFGKPAAKVELLVSNERIGTAMAQALHEAGVEAGVARKILARVYDLLNADAA